MSDLDDKSTEIEYARDLDGSIMTDGTGKPIPAAYFENEPYSRGMGETVEEYLKRNHMEY